MSESAPGTKADTDWCVHEMTDYGQPDMLCGRPQSVHSLYMHEFEPNDRCIFPAVDGVACASPESAGRHHRVGEQWPPGTIDNHAFRVHTVKWIVKNAPLAGTTESSRSRPPYEYDSDPNNSGFERHHRDLHLELADRNTENRELRRRLKRRLRAHELGQTYKWDDEDKKFLARRKTE